MTPLDSESLDAHTARLVSQARNWSDLGRLVLDAAHARQRAVRRGNAAGDVAPAAAPGSARTPPRAHFAPGEDRG